MQEITLKTASFLQLLDGVREGTFNWELWEKLEINEKII